MLLALLALALPASAATHLLVKAPTFQVGDHVGHGVITRALRVPGWRVLSLNTAPDGHLDHLRRLPGVQRVERDLPLTLASWQDEPSFALSWHLENRPTRGGQADADIDVIEAWRQGASGAGVVVAVIDTGVDLSHPDLAPALWTNLGEVPNNGIDDDLNGYIDDVHGVQAGQPDGDPSDAIGHGTEVAGIIAAQPDGRGAIGIAPGAKIMAVRIFGNDGSFASDAAEGILYASQMGADILSMSWHVGRQESTIITEALDLAIANGALPVVAAGNTPLDTDLGGYWPASTPREALLAVAASDRHDRLVYQPGLWASAYGLNSVDLSAPGDGIVTTTNGGGYSNAFNGTSAAAPMVSAVAALVWSVAPSLSATELGAVLRDATDPTHTQTRSRGRLNAAQAVHLALTGQPPLRAQIHASGSQRVGVPTRFRVDTDAEVRWHFPDSTRVLRGPEVEHAFELPGDWVVVAELRSEDGRSGRETFAVTVPWLWQPTTFEPIASLHNTNPLLGAAGISAPRDALWMRLHFSRLDLRSQGWATQDAFLSLFDTDGLWVWSWEGQSQGLWTPPLRASELGLVWQVDNARDPSWGFEIDQVQHWMPGDPVVPPNDYLRPTTNVSYASCATLPASSGAWLLLPVLLAFRRRARALAHTSATMRRT